MTSLMVIGVGLLVLAVIQLLAAVFSDSPAALVLNLLFTVIYLLAGGHLVSLADDVMLREKCDAHHKIIKIDGQEYQATPLN